MSETERLTVGAVLTILLFLVAAFVFHTSPRFAGSLAGFVLGTAAATLMLSLLIYPLAKYSTRLGSWITRLVSIRALLAFHVYAGVFGAFLAILHTGHKYQSLLGITLVVSMLVVVVTGFVGRYTCRKRRSSCGKRKLGWRRCGPPSIARSLLSRDGK